MQETTRVHFDDELPYSEQSLRRSCRRLYGHVFEMTKYRPFLNKEALQRSLNSLPNALGSEQLQQNRPVQNWHSLPSHAAREQEKERWVEPASTLHHPARRCASEIALNGNSRTCTISSQPYSWGLRCNHPLALEDGFQSPGPPLSRRRSFSSLPRGHMDETNRWRQAVVTSTKEYCSRRDRACRRTLSGYWPNVDDTLFNSLHSSHFHSTPANTIDQDIQTYDQCSLCHRNELSNCNAMAPSQRAFRAQINGFETWNEDMSFQDRRSETKETSVRRDTSLNQRNQLTDYHLQSKNSILDETSKCYGCNGNFRPMSPSVDLETGTDDESHERIPQSKVFGSIRYFQDPFLLAKFSNLSNNGGTNSNVSPARNMNNTTDDISEKNLSQDDSDSTCSSAHEEPLPTPVIGRREERNMGSYRGSERKLVYKSDSAIHVSARKNAVKKMSILQKACLAARSVKQTLRRAFSQDNIKIKNTDSNFSFRKSFRKSKNKINSHNQDTEANVSGQLLKVHDDGSLLVELKKHSSGNVGFFVARGKLKNHKGIFVCRMINMNVRSNLSGLIEIGDEILKIDGISVSTDEVLKINTMLATKSILLLTILPYTYRKELISK